MIAFISGTIYSIQQDHVILDHQGMGFRIYVADPMKYTIQKEVTLFTYQHVREDGSTLFGFSSLEEHDLFLQLISVKGVGPKTVLNMLRVCSYEQIVVAIQHEDVKLLQSLPGIGKKSASQIVLDLKGKLVSIEDTKKTMHESKALVEAMEALKALGYKASDLTTIRKELASMEGTSEDLIRQALILLAKRKGV